MTAQANIKGGVHTDERHDSAHKHVTGRAEYIDDMMEPVGTLHAYLGLSAASPWRDHQAGPHRRLPPQSTWSAF